MRTLQYFGELHSFQLCLSLAHEVQRFRPMKILNRSAGSVFHGQFRIECLFSLQNIHARGTGPRGAGAGGPRPWVDMVVFGIAPDSLGLKLVLEHNLL